MAEWTDVDWVVIYMRNNPGLAAKFFAGKAKDEAEILAWEAEMFPEPSDEKQLDYLRSVRLGMGVKGFPQDNDVVVAVNAGIDLLSG